MIRGQLRKELSSFVINISIKFADFDGFKVQKFADFDGFRV